MGYFRSREFGGIPSKRVHLEVETLQGDAPTLFLSCDLLRAGQHVTFLVSDATPGASVTFYSTGIGIGESSVPPLNATLGLDGAIPVAVVSADGSGRARFTRHLPPSVVGHPVWIQAAQPGRVSNIMAGLVE